MKIEVRVNDEWHHADDFHSACRMMGGFPPARIRIDGVAYIDNVVHGQLLGTARAQATKLRKTLNADTVKKLRSLADWIERNELLADATANVEPIRQR